MKSWMVWILVGLQITWWCVFPALAQQSGSTNAEGAVSTVSGTDRTLGGNNSATVDFSKLTNGQEVNGFRAQAVYRDDSDKFIGARFRHIHSGFTLDLLQIQTAPQAFIWVNTVPTSDKGEPHTQEHLLLGKGNKGRTLSTAERMSLVSSSAMTEQWRTCYHFNTVAGADVFFSTAKRYLDALLFPDYDDLEIEREVRNFGVTQDPASAKLRLEEKGTVYNEMVSHVNDRRYDFYRAKNRLLYGKEHPLALESGGTPAGLRQLTPQDIKDFRAQNYLLANMGMIAVLPKSVALGNALEHFDKILKDLQPQAVDSAFLKQADVPSFPAPQPAPLGTEEIVAFPDKDASKSGDLCIAWAATNKFSIREQMLLEIFLSNVAGDATTPLYKKFVDSKTRVMNIGATNVYSSVSDDQGNPIEIGIVDVASEHATLKDVAEVRKIVLAELSRVASFEDSSPELLAFNKQLKDRVFKVRRDFNKFVNSPPGFGFRWNSGFWMSFLVNLGRGNQFERSLTLKPELEFADKELSSKKNIWREYIAKWHLLDVPPYVIVSHADPKLVTAQEQATKERIAQETERIIKRYGETDAQAALHKYKDDYDHRTQVEELSHKDLSVPMIENPPLTLDDQLEFTSHPLGSTGVPLVSSTFDNMTGATTCLALRLDCVPAKDLFLLPLLPQLITQSGVIENGKPVSYEQMIERWRTEILSLNASFSTNHRTGRCELVARGAGNNPEEAKRAIGWMNLVLNHPNWRTENLHRLRDVVYCQLTNYRKVRDSGYEESWDSGLAQSYRRQDSPLLLHSTCFLTATHDSERLLWRLLGDASPEAVKSFAQFMIKLESAPSKCNRSELQALLHKIEERSGGKATASKTKASPPDTAGAAVGLSSGAQEYWQAFNALSDKTHQLTEFASKGLTEDLVDIPDGSLSSDWQTLCSEIATDVQLPPEKTLAQLDKLRSTILNKGGARLAVIGAKTTEEFIQPSVIELVDGLADKQQFKPEPYSSEKSVIARLRGRDSSVTTDPIYAGLLAPNTHQGVVMNSAPGVKYLDLDDDSILRFLSFQLFSGGGAHTIFMKTWGAGLAYGNGLGTSPNFRLSYYADKTPALPDTIRFVITELKKAPKNPWFAEYATAQSFDSRAADGYESRGESMADDLVDLEPPDAVKKFRQAVLKMHSRNDLANELFARMLPMYAKVLPGLGQSCKTVQDGCYFIIGDEKQFSLYDDYLKSVDGPDTKLYRLYGRDFWVE